MGRSEDKGGRGSAGTRPAKGARSGAFTDEERAAMKERAEERARSRGGSGASPSDEESAVLAKIAEMPEPDRALAARVHDLVRATAPSLSPRTWYGMPAYARDGKVVCFFQGASKFKARYATLGFSDSAGLDDGPMWPTSFAVTEWSADVESRVAALVRRAVGRAAG